LKYFLLDPLDVRLARLWENERLIKIFLRLLGGLAEIL
jgi:hypothetical protein